MATDGKIPAAADADAATAKAPQSAYGGGGSAFAHLTEDTEYPEIRADWVIRGGGVTGNPVFRASDDFPMPEGAGVTKQTDIYAGRIEVYAPVADLTASVFSVWDWENENAAYLDIHLDGSLHWGDGTAAPDVSFSRVPGSLGSLAVIPGPSETFLVGEAGIGEAYSSIARGSGSFYGVGVNDQIALLTDSDVGLGFNRPGVAIQLPSPNGTFFNITVSNAGAVVVTAA